MEIVSGYSRKCKSRVSGIKTIWMLKFVKHSKTLIQTSGNFLTKFPETFVYKFDSLQNPTPVQTMGQNEGGKFYDISVSLTFVGTEIGQLERLQKSDVRMLTLDNNGIYRIYGLYNGLTAGNITYTTGQSKADLNGFKIDFTGQEEKEAFFVLDPFEIGFINEGFNYYLDFTMYG